MNNWISFHHEEWLREGFLPFCAKEVERMPAKQSGEILEECL